MISSEVRRTLVKSPPELWSELSNPESLSSHLSGLGEITITRSENETALEWETNGARGSVQLDPSGFGTRVTLSLTREPPEPAGAGSDEAEIGFDTPEAVPVLEPSAVSSPEVLAEPPDRNKPSIVEQTAEPRIGFFARLFRRRRAARLALQESIESEMSLPAGPEPAAIEMASPESTPEADSIAKHDPDGELDPVDAATGPAAELTDMEAQMVEQDAEMLSAMLDRLGAAHHRPFSRG